MIWDGDAGGRLRLLQELRPVEVGDNVLPDGSVQKYRMGAGEHDPSYPVIHAEVDGEALTLLDSFSSRRSSSSLEASPETVTVNGFVRGVWFTERDDLSADMVRVEMTHLTGWVVESGLEQDSPRWENPDDGRFVVVTSRSLSPMKVEHESAAGPMRVALAQQLRGVGDDIYASGVEQRWDLILRFPEPKPVEVFSAMASDIQDLVSLGVGDAAQFVRFRFQHPVATWKSGDPDHPREGREDLEYFSRWHVKAKDSDPVNEYAHYFTLRHLGGLEGGMAAIARWMTVAEKYRTELGRVMATRYSADMYLEDRIMNCCAALDSFDKTRRETGRARVDYVDRIRECVTLAGEPFLGLIVGDATGWSEMVRDARNDLAHHRDRFRIEGSVGEHLLSQQLFWLFAMCMLRLADAPEAVFGPIVKHRQVVWLRGQAEKSSGSA